MNTNTEKAVFALRFALAATFLSSVASRFGWWGGGVSAWEEFVAYTAQMNSFAPEGISPTLAISATVLETAFGLLLLVGFKTRLVAFGSGILTFIFALVMTISFGLEAPLQYSVFVFSTASWVLASLPASNLWSVDGALGRK